MAEATRVALLARPGGACDRLQAALRDAGADVVLVADPTATTAADVRASGARAVLIALEPAVEDVLDRFEEVLVDPSILVIFDEAELAAQREGWDAARWTRHLAAKLGGHGDVLPPGTEAEPDAIELQPGRPQLYERPETDLDFASFASEVESLAEAVPRDEITPAVDADAPPDGTSFDPVAFEFEDAGPVAGDVSIDLGIPEFEGAVSGEESAASAELGIPDFEFDVSRLEMPADPVIPVPDAASLSLEDDTVSEMPAFDAASLSLEETPSDEPGLTAFEVTTLSLEDNEERADVSGAGAASGAFADDDLAARDRFQRDLDDLNVRIADMELVDSPRARTPAQANGAVVVLAGIGGPDAVRQLLGGLPAGFPRPVLVQQRLDGARHDKLVRQMQRATTMAVHLAEAGTELESGNVYVLPAELGLSASEKGLRLDASGDLLAQLPSADSAVILLSGSDAAIVDAAMSHAARGALVAGQAPDGCYDPAASEALIARGAESGAPAQLAKKLAARWPA